MISPLRLAIAPLLLFAAVSNDCLQAQSSPSSGLEAFELKSRIFQNTRTIRVLLPPSYNDDAAGSRKFPVCYFLDGRAAFDDRGWGVVPAAKALWKSGRIPEYIFIGIDNGGSTRESTNPVADRAGEFLPYPDPSWTDSPPISRGKEHPGFLLNEVIPAVESRYRATSDSALCLAGDSYAGIAALYAAMQHPDRIKRLLLESPSLHVGSGRMLKDAEGQPSWPERVYLGVGTAEGGTREDRREMADNVKALAKTLSSRGAVSVKLRVVAGAEHSYDAWRTRLPDALIFLLGPASR